MLKTARRPRPRTRSAVVRPEPTKSSSVTATEAKNQFGQLLERAIKGERVYITRHEAPKAVLISVDDFRALSSHAKTKLNSLTSEFDSLLARMQAPGARAATKAAFGASPEQLGIAAVEASKKRY
jgi:antitoxin Phd